MRSFRYSSETSRRLALLQQPVLHLSVSPFSFAAHFLKQRLKLALFQSCDQGRVIRFNSQLIDRHRQFHTAIELDHFSVLQNLFASIGELLPGSVTFHFVDIVQQRLQPTELANQCPGGFAAQANSGDVIDRIARPISLGGTSHFPVT